ncbi:hypothetical protein [Streptomyces avicenniae]|uniref:hypothetical protein n=1 Tax=Streptomyces avicenniae TaxID=500153 RepID=UPI00069C9F5F|nr:hypothetical protein [Streptomyces avicenniae]
MTAGRPTAPPRPSGRATAAVLAGAALLLLGGCGSEPGGEKPDRAGQEKPTEHADRQAGAGELPDLTGLSLPEARESAGAAGFEAVTSHDALGRDRMQLVDGNWVVCSQQPPAGPHAGGTEVALAVVKAEEECPEGDRSTAPPEAGDTAPDLTGESVNVARAALGRAASVDVRDVSGDGRMILVESNWQVCAQTPGPGAPLDGARARLDAVKFGEDCP